MQKLKKIALFGCLGWILINYGGGSVPVIAATPDRMFPAEQPFSLACQDTIIVSLDTSCQVVLQASSVATGSLPTCLTANDFLVRVADANPGNQDTLDQPGFWPYQLTLKDTAPDCSDFQPCWGVVRAEDKTAPVIAPPADIDLDIFCIDLDTVLNQESSLAFTGLAEVEDNCSSGPVPLRDFSDVLTLGDACADWVIVRTFQATDAYGNSAIARQQIRLIRPDLSDVALQDTVFKYNLDCSAAEEYQQDDNGHLHPAIAGYPFLVDEFGAMVPLNQDICGLTASYTDQVFEVCAATHKIVRNWRIVDDCSGLSRTIEQLIVVGDLQAPRLHFAQSSYDFSTTLFSCTGAIQVVRPQIEEQCSATQTQVSLYHLNTRFNGSIDTLWLGTRPLEASDTYFSGVDPGDYLLVYQVRDVCHNEQQDTIRARVLDLMKPVARCKDELHVTLDNFGFAKVTVADIDEGSADNCGLDSLRLRRAYRVDNSCHPAGYSAWSEEVYFACCDLEAPVTVELRARDHSGHLSSCWAEVLIEEKEVPLCTAPPPVSVDCDYLPAGFDFTDTAALAQYFGTATGSANCRSTQVLEYAPLVDLSTCGFGTITRTFAIEDEQGNLSMGECTQQIAISSVHNYEVKFPADYSTICAEPDPDSLGVTSLGCDLIAVASSDTRHVAASEECYRIMRNFKVINWCEYDGQADPFILPRDLNCDGISGNQAFYLLVRPNGTVYLDANDNELDNLPLANTDYDCWGQQGSPAGYWTNTDSFPALVSTGFWEYTQIISVNDTIAPVIFLEDSVFVCITTEDCAAEAAVSFAILDECVDGEVVIETYFQDLNDEFEQYMENPWTLVGRYPKYIMTGTIPEGNYQVEIEASDQCGNISRVAYYLEVVDCTGPAITCHDGLVVELNPLGPGVDVDNDGEFDGGVSFIGVEDMLASYSLDDCTGPVTYSINRATEVPHPEQQSLTLTCKDGTLLDVEIYAWDGATNPNAIQPDGQLGGANYTYCKTSIYIQDHQDACSPVDADIAIAGQIRTATGDPIANVEVDLSGASRQLVYSNQAGNYLFSALEAGQDYTIVPRKTDERLKGVSTLDLIYITRHILGIQPLTLDLQLLAADVNRSGSITTYDAILLRKAILHTDPAATNWVGWQFIQANTRLKNQGDPWSQPMSAAINLNNISYAQDGLDFIGIKIGDVSGLQGLRSVGGSRSFSLANRLVMEGEMVRLPLYLPSDEAWEGMQLRLELVPGFAGQLRVSPAAVGEGFFSLSGKKEAVLIAWDRYSGATPAPGQPLLYLEWQALQTALLSEQLQISRAAYWSEAYEEGRAFPLHLDWEDRSPVAEVGVYPIPFRNRVFLRWNAAWAAAIEKSDWQIQLIDTQGKLLQTNYYPAGHAATGADFPLDLPAHLPEGLYILRLQAGHESVYCRIVK